MATLERIRRRSGLLIVLIGLAMLAFILTDLFSSGGSVFQSQQTVVGKVNGTAIEFNEFDKLLTQRRTDLERQSPDQARFATTKQLADAVWDQFLREKLVKDSYSDMGFSVTGRELSERIKQNPTIQNAPAFKDQVTGNFSEALLQQYITNLRDNSEANAEAAELYQQWIVFERATKEDALSLKLNKAVQEGLYMPAALAKEIYQRNNTQINLQFVALENSSIVDSTIEVSDADIKSYFKENKEQFKTEETRQIQYVGFNIEPSGKDRSELLAELESYKQPEVVFNKVDKVYDTIPSFENTENDSLYAISRSDVNIPPNYFKSGAAGVADSILFTLDTGDVYGPYEDGSYYYLTKISDIKDLPDSVRVRQIVISFSGANNNGQETPDRTPQEAKALADSLIEVVRGDTSQFLQIVNTFSDDQLSKITGGNLPWMKETDQQSFTNFAFRNDLGSIGMTYSQQGVHIVEILEQGGSNKALKLVNIAREIAPSQRTSDSIYNIANNFASSVSSVEEFSEKAEASGYSPRPVTNIEIFDENLPGIGNNRELVRWIYNEETELGNMKLIENNGTIHIVVMLAGIDEEGYANPLEIRDRIEPLVRNEKKAEQLSKKLQEAAEGAADINEVASKLGVQVNVQVLNFEGNILTGFGNEPKVVGAFSGLEAGSGLSTPIAGDRGVYMAQVIGVTPAQDLPDYSEEKQKLEQNIRPRAASEIFLSLKEGAKIKDRRSTFY